MGAAVDPSLALERIATLLASTPSVLETQIGSMGEELAAWHPALAEWCAKQVVGYLIEAEQRSFVGRITTVLNSPAQLLEAWEAAPLAAARRDCDRRPVAVATCQRRAPAEGAGTGSPAGLALRLLCAAEAGGR